MIVAAVRAGAIGFLPKTAPLHALVQAIRAAAQGQVSFSAAASARLVQELQTPAVEPEHLTERELQVVSCITDGLSNKEIARNLRISEKTVKSHVSTILSKFGLQSRTQLALHATRTGLVPGGRTMPSSVRAVEHNVVSFEHQRRARRPFIPRASNVAAS